MAIVVSHEAQVIQATLAFGVAFAVTAALCTERCNPLPALLEALTATAAAAAPAAAPAIVQSSVQTKHSTSGIGATRGAGPARAPGGQATHERMLDSRTVCMYVCTSQFMFGTCKV